MAIVIDIRVDIRDYPSHRNSTPHCGGISSCFVENQRKIAEKTTSFACRQCRHQRGEPVGAWMRKPAHCSYQPDGKECGNSLEMCVSTAGANRPRAGNRIGELYWLLDFSFCLSGTKPGPQHPCRLRLCVQSQLFFEQVRESRQLW